MEEAEGNRVRIHQRNKFCLGDEIEIMKPDGRDIHTRVRGMTTEDGQSVESAPHAKQLLYVELEDAADVYDILRMKAEQNG